MGYGINALWFAGLKQTGQYHEVAFRNQLYTAAESIDAVPNPSGVYIFTELNRTTFTTLTGMQRRVRQLKIAGFWNPTHLSFTDAGQPAAAPRMIDPKDQRHRGNTTLGFFDGRAEVISITPDNLTWDMFHGGLAP